jgi:hypothetical protein
LASTVTAPIPVVVSLFPEIVAGPEITVYVIASPEDALAVSVTAGPPADWVGMDGKVIVCESCRTVKLWFTAAAAW